MPTIHIGHTRKVVLALEEAVVFDLHLVNDLDFHSVEYIYDIVREYNFGSDINYLIVLLYFHCFRKIKS